MSNNDKKTVFDLVAEQEAAGIPEPNGAKEPTTPSSVRAQTPAKQEQLLCPKCGEAIWPEQDARPDGSLVCSGTKDDGTPCRAKWASYDALVAAIEKADPGPAILDYNEIDVDLIDPNPEQPRREFGEAKLKELAASIKAHGLIQPITIEKKGMRYILHDGERRLRAAKQAGLRTIRANIVEAGADRQVLLVRAVVANVQRDDLTAIEFARACQELADLGLSDAEIGKEFGKGRSTIANARRLLELPADIQARIESGEKNELSQRQAAALLPLYQLPAEVRQGIRNTWDGGKLDDPNLTSDQIRNHVRGAMRSHGLTVSLIEPATPYDATVKEVRAPTCVGCGLLVKVGKSDELCMDPICLKAKQNQVIAIYLADASAATGVPALDPAEDCGWNRATTFYESSQDALEIALDKCDNLHLAYNRNTWESGIAPDGYDRCRYVCFHGEGKECACREAVRADKNAEREKQKQEAERLRGRIVDHVIGLIDDNHPGLLRAILYKSTGYWNNSDRVLEYKPEKVIRQLAYWLIEREANPVEHGTSESNRERIDTWLAKLDLPPLDGGDTDPAADISARLDRIATWLKDARKAVPTPAQVRGNLANLAKIAADVRQMIEDEAVLAAQRERIAALEAVLTELEPIVEAGRNAIAGKPDNINIGHVSWLLTVPSGDINFKSHLKASDTAGTLRYTLALFPLFRQGKTAREAIERRLRALEKGDNLPQIIARLRLDFDKVTAWLDANIHDTTDKKYINKHTKLGDIGGEVTALLRQHDSDDLRTLLAEIEQAEADYMRRRREAVGAQTGPEISV